MLADLKLKNLKAKEKPYKVADRDGLYVLVTTAGSLLFRYDYRINGLRETLALGRYDDTRAKKVPREIDDLDYGVGKSLAEARPAGAHHDQDCLGQSLAFNHAARPGQTARSTCGVDRAVAPAEDHWQGRRLRRRGPDGPCREAR
jgi:hypothetical protein